VEARRACGSVGVKMSTRYDIVIQDKYSKGFGSRLQYLGRTEAEIAEIIEHKNSLTPDIKNRWRVASKKETVLA
jgi:2-hydroxy-3-keto-5-methylthiopentenyl-1-phosphate phosphatase